jgi:hypothetical protein
MRRHSPTTLCHKSIPVGGLPCILVSCWIGIEGSVCQGSNIIENQNRVSDYPLHVKIAEELTPWRNQPSHNLSSVFSLRISWKERETQLQKPELPTVMVHLKTEGKFLTSYRGVHCPVCGASSHDSPTHVYAPCLIAYRHILVFREHQRNAAFCSTDVVSGWVTACPSDANSGAFVHNEWIPLTLSRDRNTRKNKRRRKWRNKDKVKRSLGTCAITGPSCPSAQHRTWPTTTDFSLLVLNQCLSSRWRNLTLSLLMSKLLVKPEILTSHIYGPTFGNAESRLFLFAAQCFNI